MIGEWRSEPQNRKQQEPRILAQYAQDENMINAYKNKKDLYATVASTVHKNGYWDNMEHYEDGTPNPDGKKRRGAIKSVVLGISYGSGAATVAEQITDGRRDKNGNIKEEDICTTQEAQDIINKFYEGFPKVRKWIDETQKFAKRTGYVEDIFGRRRRLPDLLLPKYDVIDQNSRTKKFNPLLNIDKSICKEESEKEKFYRDKLAKCSSFKDVASIKAQAKKDNLDIVDNSGFVSRAERQCINARVQGAAASMSKKAMIASYKDEELRRLGFRLLIVVHDELIGECPKENAEQVSKRLTEIMLGAALPEVTTPMKCDIEVTSRWYENDYADVVRSEFSKLVANGMSKEDAKNSIIEKRKESTIEELLKIIGE